MTRSFPDAIVRVEGDALRGSAQLRLTEGEEMDSRKAICKVKQMMQSSLNNAQMERLIKVLDYCFFEQGMPEAEGADIDNTDLLARFISAKQLEGCSGRSLKYYRATLQAFLDVMEKGAREMTTNDIRSYLSGYCEKGHAGQVTIDNIRRIISSFFTWLEDENYILKSPARRIKKIKCLQTVKEVYSDEDIEMLRDGCSCMRNLAIVDLLRSSGMRVSELVGLDRKSVDMVNRECRVLGKGRKERVVYFDSRTKVHLEAYLESRDDDGDALFVSLNSPHERLRASGVETFLRKMGRDLNMGRVHPHKFRRTLATKAIDKGMPIEQVQVLLGHKKIDTTLRYAMVDQSNVKASHRRYIA